MDTTTRATRRGIAIGLAVAMLGMLLWQTLGGEADATPPAQPAAAYFQAGGDDVLPPPLPPANEGWFAKYDGVDGESQDQNHDKWIDVLSIDWGVHATAAGASGASRRRGAPAVDDFVISFQYEKSAPKLLEACLTGKVFPKLEIELTRAFSDAGQATYLRYEMKNATCRAYDVSGTTAGPPIVVVGNNFEEIKVTYTEYDDTGASKGNVETEWKVEKGEK